MDKTLKDILVPVDFKEPSLNALTYAVNLARKIEGKIHLLHVLEMGGILADLFLSVDEVIKVTEKAKDKLQELADNITNTHGLETYTRIERGKPHQKILETARELHPRFVILGENHQGTNSEQVLGSTVEQVTLNCEVPVITTKSKNSDLGSLMVVPLDLTQKTRKKISSAILFAKHYDMKISLVSALIGGIKTRESRIFKKLKQAKQTIEDSGIQCSMKLFPRSEIPPYQRVLQYSHQIEASLIMVMTHQEGFTFDNYIGAFAHQIINESDIPVLSLTSSATSHDFDTLLKDLIDPLSIMDRDHILPRKGARISIRKSNS